jgi:hypothetical protein
MWGDGILFPMKKNLAPIIIIGAAVVVVILLLWKPWVKDTSASSPELIAFGECLASKGAVMYGAYWCPQCQNEKKTLGDGFEKITYVECTQETAKCTAAGIEGYPTWILGDGTKLVGEQGLDGLSRATGCPLPGSGVSSQ